MQMTAVDDSADLTALLSPPGPNPYPNLVKVELEPKPVSQVTQV
ncbi:unnamed protein product, partial [Allacma fusca]